MLKMKKGARAGFLVAFFSVYLLTLSYVVAENAKIIDNFDNIYNWKVMCGDETFLELTKEAGFKGDSLCLNYTLAEKDSYVIAARDIELTLPSNFKLTFYIKGSGPNNNLEFKLIDGEGNVFWKKWEHFRFSNKWQMITLYREDISFAWGPNPNAQLRKIESIEFAISATTGGRGKVFIDELILSAL